VGGIFMYNFKTILIVLSIFGGLVEAKSFSHSSELAQPQAVEEKKSQVALNILLQEQRFNFISDCTAMLKTYQSCRGEYLKFLLERRKMFKALDNFKVSLLNLQIEIEKKGILNTSKVFNKIAELDSPEQATYLREEFNISNEDVRHIVAAFKQDSSAGSNFKVETVSSASAFSPSAQ
jgi:hypothetical protein